MRFPVLLFAAGLGTRMGDLVKDRPKPLVQVAGKPLIDHALALTEVPEVGTRVVNLHYLHPCCGPIWRGGMFCFPTKPTFCAKPAVVCDTRCHSWGQGR